jgi:hypothetical protein
METVQSFNHLQRATQTVFNLPVQDGEIYLETQVRTDNSLDDQDRGGMNRIFSTISYSGTNRPFYLRYMPYYLMTMRAPLFLHALPAPAIIGDHDPARAAEFAGEAGHSLRRAARYACDVSLGLALRTFQPDQRR